MAADNGTFGVGLAFVPWSVDNSVVTDSRPKSIPLPCALLALSVVVCLGAAGPIEASTFRASSSVQAEQRETLEHLLDAIQQAARKLTDQLTGQSAMLDCRAAVCLTSDGSKWTALVHEGEPTILILREALLNLPPPAR